MERRPDAADGMIDRISVTAARHMLFNEAARLQHADQRTALDCIANRIGASRMSTLHELPVG